MLWPTRSSKEREDERWNHEQHYVYVRKNAKGELCQCFLKAVGKTICAEIPKKYYCVDTVNWQSN